MYTFSDKKKLLAFVVFFISSTGFIRSHIVSDFVSYSSEALTILSMYVKNPAEVGEIAPISQAVGHELSKFVGEATEQGKNYLEAGGGCGAVSVCIAKKLHPQDHLDVIEINPEMCEKLKKRLAKYKNISVHCCSILDWKPDYQYDAIISTLPFLSLGMEFAQQTVAYFKTVVKQDGMFSCVEYPVCTFCKDLVQKVCPKKIKDFTSVQNYMKKVRSKYLQTSATIYFNVPPINVYHLCFNVA